MSKKWVGKIFTVLALAAIAALGLKSASAEVVYSPEGSFPVHVTLTNPVTVNRAASVYPQQYNLGLGVAGGVTAVTPGEGTLGGDPSVLVFTPIYSPSNSSLMTGFDVAVSYKFSPTAWNPVGPYIGVYISLINNQKGTLLGNTGWIRRQIGSTVATVASIATPAAPVLPPSGSFPVTVAFVNPMKATPAQLVVTAKLLAGTAASGGAGAGSLNGTGSVTALTAPVYNAAGLLTGFSATVNYAFSPTAANPLGTSIDFYLNLATNTTSVPFGSSPWLVRAIGATGATAVPMNTPAAPAPAPAPVASPSGSFPVTVTFTNPVNLTVSQLTLSAGFLAGNGASNGNGAGSLGGGGGESSVTGIYNAAGQLTGLTAVLNYVFNPTAANPLGSSLDYILYVSNANTEAAIGQSAWNVRAIGSQTPAVLTIATPALAAPSPSGSFPISVTFTNPVSPAQLNTGVNFLAGAGASSGGGAGSLPYSTWGITSFVATYNSAQLITAYTAVLSYTFVPTASNPLGTSLDFNLYENNTDGSHFAQSGWTVRTIGDQSTANLTMVTPAPAAPAPSPSGSFPISVTFTNPVSPAQLNTGVNFLAGAGASAGGGAGSLPFSTWGLTSAVNNYNSAHLVTGYTAVLSYTFVPTASNPLGTSLDFNLYENNTDGSHFAQSGWTVRTIGDQSTANLTMVTPAPAPVVPVAPAPSPSGSFPVSVTFTNPVSLTVSQLTLSPGFLAGNGAANGNGAGSLGGGGGESAVTGVYNSAGQLTGLTATLNYTFNPTASNPLGTALDFILYVSNANTEAAIGQSAWTVRNIGDTSVANLTVATPAPALPTYNCATFSFLTVPSCWSAYVATVNSIQGKSNVNCLTAEANNQLYACTQSALPGFTCVSPSANLTGYCP